MPAHPGLGIYAITKGVGHEITRVYADNTPGLKVLNVIWTGFYNPEPSDERRFDGSGAPGGDTQVPCLSRCPVAGTRCNSLNEACRCDQVLSVSWRDAGDLLRACIDVPLDRLPRACQTLFGQTNLPHGRCKLLPANALCSRLSFVSIVLRRFFACDNGDQMRICR